MMVGYIVGVGIFGLPFIIAKAGIIPFLFFFLLLAPVQYLIHLIYGSAVLATKGFHRLPGQAEAFLGKRWKVVVFVGKMISTVGALLAYIIATGIFANELFSPYFGGSAFVYANIFFFLAAIIVYRGLGFIAKTELLMTLFLLLVVGLIVWKSVPEISLANYLTLDWRYFILPYGALLFSLDGNASLPAIARLLDRDASAMKKVIVWGTAISAFVTLVFALVISGVSGEATSVDALSGVRGILDGIVALSLLFGLLCLATSFFGAADALKETLRRDFGLSRTISWAFAVSSPYFLYLAGIADLIEVIYFVGALGGGICALVIVRISVEMKRRGQKPALLSASPRAIVHILLALMFLAGMIYTLYDYFVK